jgi:chorismate mutase / prephenate dehydratase
MKSVAGGFLERMYMTEGLDDFRRRIDECDKALVELINKRLGICLEVGDFKAERGMEVRHPDREMEVIDRAAAHNGGPCPDDAVKKVFRLLIDTAVELEENHDIARPEK